MDEFRKIYKDEICPIIEKQNRYANAMLLEPVSKEDNFISCTMWDNKENADAYEASGTYKEMVVKVLHTLEAPPTIKSYEVKN